MTRVSDILVVDNGASVASPLYFDSGGGRLFAWLHSPSSAINSNHAVVICNPFGYETICAHRSIREFAEQIAATGRYVMRFDYLGTGDSADMDQEADFLRHWTDDVSAAIRALKCRTGAEKICLLGIRLGALIASQAALESNVVDDVILVGPVVSGRRYLRQLRLVQRSGASAVESVADKRPGDPQSEALEAGGFILSAATVASLGAVDLARIQRPLAASVLIIDDDALPAARAWAESMAERHPGVDYRALPGLVDMVMTAPHFAVTPQSMIDSALEWLGARSHQRVESVRPAGASGESFAITFPDAPAAPELILGDQGRLDPGVRETPVLIESEARLFGVLAELNAPMKPRGAVILLNPGVDFHIGASRIYVTLARRWARDGYVVLRMDFAGIGDSEARKGRSKDDPFPEEALEDIRIAMDFVRSRYGIPEITLAGLCSGGYHSLRAAAAGMNMNRIILLNPQSFFWKRGMSLKDVTIAEVVQNPGIYRERMFSWKAWRRIFNGEVDVVRIGSIFIRRVGLAAEVAVRGIARALKLRLPMDLGWELDGIIARGVRVSFIFARGEPGIALLKLQAGRRVMKLGDRCRVRIVDGGDHIFSQQGPRVMMENIMSEELMVGDSASRPD